MTLNAHNQYFPITRISTIEKKKSYEITGKTCGSRIRVRVGVWLLFSIRSKVGYVFFCILRVLAHSSHPLLSLFFSRLHNTRARHIYIYTQVQSQHDLRKCGAYIALASTIDIIDACYMCVVSIDWFYRCAGALCIFIHASAEIRSSLFFFLLLLFLGFYCSDLFDLACKL